MEPNRLGLQGHGQRQQSAGTVARDGEWISLSNTIARHIPYDFRSRRLTALHWALHTQIAGKWKYAAGRYRVENPGVLLPDQKHQLLPIDVAESKMAVWIPWAIQELQGGLAQLLLQFDHLTVEQQAQVRNDPEEEVFEDEFV